MAFAKPLLVHSLHKCQKGSQDYVEFGLKDFFIGRDISLMRYRSSCRGLSSDQSFFVIENRPFITRELAFLGQDQCVLSIY